MTVDPVIPCSSSSGRDDNLTRSDGFTVPMDHQELGRVAKTGRVAEVAMSTLFHNLLIPIKRNWQVPALVPIVEPY